MHINGLCLVSIVLWISYLLAAWSTGPEKVVIFRAVHECESWTLRKSGRENDRCFHIMDLETVTKRKAHHFILEQIKSDCSFEAMINKQKFTYFGQVMWADGLGKKIIMLGQVERSRWRGKQSKVGGQIQRDYCDALGKAVGYYQRQIETAKICPCGDEFSLMALN